jgi:hypothetical protein
MKSKSVVVSPGVRPRLGWLLPILVSGAACTSILGIEDLHPDPQPSGGSAGMGASAGVSAGGTSGTNGKGGSTTGGKGGSSTGGSSVGGHGGSGGSDSGSAGKGGTDTGGTGGTTGGTGGKGGSGNAGHGGSSASGGRASGSGGAAGMAGEAGTGGGQDTTVRGRVVNHWLQPISGLTVTIGSASADTDTDGNFVIPDVAETYDAEMVVTFKRYGNEGPQYGWVYQGLTRRDPTLEVYEGLSLREGNLEFTPQNVPGTAGETIATALGGDYGDWNTTSSTAEYTSMDWYGPNEITMHGYGLSWIETNSLPTSYTAYTTLSSPVTIADDGGTTMITLDFTPNTVSAGTISGSVTSPTTDQRSNGVWVRFASNASIQVVSDYGSTLLPAFSYTVPNLPTSSITIAAIEGDSYYGSAALAHVDGVAAGDSNIALAIPAPPTLTSPADGATLSDSTTFNWSGTAKTYVWSAVSENWYEGVYVVTTSKQIKMPTFSNGFTLRPGDTAVWRVETHEDAKSVDEMTGAEGFADEFGYSQADHPEGPRRASGTWAISTGREIKTPP